MTKKQASSKTETPANEGRNRNLFVTVDTLNAQNERIGTRVVDMYHFGTRAWLQNHHWWAMHNGHTVVTEVATPDIVEAHLQSQREALAAKFNVGEPQAAVA